MYYFDPYDLDNPIKNFLDSRNMYVYPLDGMSINMEISMRENIVELEDSIFPFGNKVTK